MHQHLAKNTVKFNAPFDHRELVLNQKLSKKSAVWRGLFSDAVHNPVTVPRNMDRYKDRYKALPNKALQPFQMIWMPMQNRMKADSRITTSVPRLPRNAMMRSAKR